MGDLIQTLPLIRLLARRSVVHLVCDSAVAEWAQLLPGVDSVQALDTRKWRGRCSEPRAQFPGLCTELSSEISRFIHSHSEEIYPLNDFPLGNLLATILCHEDPRSWITDRLLQVRAYIQLIGTMHGLNRLHLSDLWRSLAGMHPPILNFSFAIPELGTQFAQTVLEGFKRRKTKRLWAIILGSGAEYRRLDPEVFAAWWSALPPDDRPGVVLLGGRGEEQLAARFLAAVGGAAEGTLNLIGSCSPVELLGIFDAVDLVVGVDTGPLHWAAAVGTPVLGLYFGEAGRYDTGPYGNGHVVLTPNCPQYPCSPMVAQNCGWKCKQIFQKPGAITDLLADLARGETSLCEPPPGLQVHISVLNESGAQYLSLERKSDDAGIIGFTGLVRRVLALQPQSREEPRQNLSLPQLHRIQRWCGAWMAQIEQLSVGNSISAARLAEIRIAATRGIRQEMDELLSRLDAENENPPAERCLLSTESAVAGA
jgi:ADP-heptose:LPS heptosyltransferase